MASELLSILIRLNLVAGGAIVAVLMLRPHIRRGFGPHATYALWVLVPFATLGALMPAADGGGAAGPVELAQGHAEIWLAEGGHAAWLIGAWALGVAVSGGLAALRYRQFVARARAGQAGPAILGVFCPRIVTPSDFRTRFSEEERRLVLAHERAHMDRLDARWNALALALQCLNWFNPLAYAALRAMRFDQELACDATVLEGLPEQRRRYAEALLRTFEGGTASPLGCGWGGGALAPVVTRLTALMRRPPDDGRRETGYAVMSALFMAAFVAGWAAQAPYRRPLIPQLITVDLTPHYWEGVQPLVTPREIGPKAPS